MSSGGDMDKAKQMFNAGRVAEAGEVCDRVLAARPDDLDALNLGGIIDLQFHRFESAEARLGKLAAARPEEAAFHHNYATALRGLGRLDEAAQRYRAALRLKPDYPQCYFSLVALEPDAAMIATLEDQLSRPGRSADDRSYLHFAVARLYEIEGDYDRAFLHYREGNIADGSAFDVDDFDRKVESLMRIFDGETLRRRCEEGTQEELAVFVVGMPRSGTTLAQQVIASHPQAFGAGELPDIASIIVTLPRHANGVAYPDCIPQLGADAMHGFGEALLKRLRSFDADAKRIVDKNPLNFQHLGLIALLTPRAKVVHCVRDAFDTCLSCYFQRFRSGQHFSYNLYHLGRFYRAYNRLMEHWAELLPLAMFELSYEKLVAKQERTSRKLVKYIGLPWDRRCLDFHELDAPLATTQREARSPIYKTSVEKWRRYEAYLQPLIDGLQGRAAG